MRKCSYLFEASQHRTRSLEQDATMVMFPACPADHVVHYTIVRYRLCTCAILDRTAAVLDFSLVWNLTSRIPNRTTNEVTAIGLKSY